MRPVVSGPSKMGDPGASVCGPGALPTPLAGRGGASCAGRSCPSARLQHLGDGREEAEAVCLRRRSRSPSDCLGALLSGAWLVNCLESGVVEGAVSKMALRSRMLISGILLGEPGPLPLPGLTYHAEDRGLVPTWPGKLGCPSCSPIWGPQVLLLPILLGPEPVPEVVLTHSLSHLAPTMQ